MGKIENKMDNIVNKKVTDYKFCAAILRQACKSVRCVFVDVPVCWDDDGFAGVRNGRIYIGHPKTIAQSLANITFVYLKHFKEITGINVFNSKEQENAVSLLIANFIRKLTTRLDDISDIGSEPVVQRLYQYRFVWLLMQDLICPIYSIPIINHRVIYYNTPKFDISGCFEDNQEEGETLSSFLNSGISYDPCLFAALFLASLECHGLNPAKVVQDILESDVKGHFVGFAKLAFKDDMEVDDFVDFVLTFTNLENKIEIMIDKTANILSGDMILLYKESQHQRNASDSSWWYFGLLEKMLESVRGADWTTYKSLTPYLREIWDKIHAARKKKGLDGLNYEALLRVKSKETDESPRILESLLGSDRVW